MTRGSFGRNLTKMQRTVHKDNMYRFEHSYGKLKASRELDRCKKSDQEKMKEVLEFFLERCPFEIDETANKAIKRVFDAGTKSQYGMILFLDKIVSWPEWRNIAFEQFNIHIT